jgi:hypothetical protein
MSNLNIKTTTLPVVLYWCGSWPLILREGCNVWMFHNRMLNITCKPMEGNYGNYNKNLTICTVTVSKKVRLDEEVT